MNNPIKLAGLAAITLLSIQANAKTFYADVHLTHLQPTVSEATWVRTKQVTPRYPLELAKSGTAGCGVFKLTINEQGKTEAIELVSSIPKRAVKRPATKVIKQWDWQLVAGKTPVAEEKLIRLDFCMGGSTLEEAKARCVAQSKMACSG
ncbi:energy transducer TonB [Paraferrimonas sedimenticola]|uniref:TonB C-terminal domain-containing protein n=1 Tax=Paraferrimonas sedimenticola TaxID=375674 RepID=A0AA37RYX1_9GAMM|nr:energy transducer TonB [Paraferrimonas sedimenticola]GLP98040.1 hypothetical protein GCM10007895_33470 [Paraferrimonas sedimenticola]